MKLKQAERPEGEVKMTRKEEEMDTKYRCQWTGCDKPYKDVRTDGHFRKMLCEYHLALTSRNPKVALDALSRKARGEQ